MFLIVTGGAAGGGYSQVIPMEEVILRLTLVCSWFVGTLPFWVRCFEVTED